MLSTNQQSYLDTILWVTQQQKQCQINYIWLANCTLYVCFITVHVRNVNLLPHQKAILERYYSYHLILQA